MLIPSMMHFWMKLLVLVLVLVLLVVLAVLLALLLVFLLLLVLMLNYLNIFNINYPLILSNYLYSSVIA